MSGSSSTWPPWSGPPPAGEGHTHSPRGGHALQNQQTNKRLRTGVLWFEKCLKIVHIGLLLFLHVCLLVINLCILEYVVEDGHTGVPRAAGSQGAEPALRRTASSVMGTGVLSKGQDVGYASGRRRASSL